MMVKSKIYKGIEYVQFSELPIEQQEILKHSVNRSLFIKILINGKIQSDCIQFKDYTAWFESIYKTQPSSISELAFKNASGVRTPSLSVKDN